MDKQDFLRQQVKKAKECNQDWKYYQFAEVISITPAAFYNWLKGYYSLSNQKRNELEQLISNLLDQ